LFGTVPYFTSRKSFKALGKNGTSSCHVKTLHLARRSADRMQRNTVPVLNQLRPASIEQCAEIETARMRREDVANQLIRASPGVTEILCWNAQMV
jgi:hypothetical protein